MSGPINKNCRQVGWHNNQLNTAGGPNFNTPSKRHPSPIGFIVEVPINFYIYNLLGMYSQAPRIWESFDFHIRGGGWKITPWKINVVDKLTFGGPGTFCDVHLASHGIVSKGYSTQMYSIHRINAKAYHLKVENKSLGHPHCDAGAFFWHDGWKKLGTP